MVKVKTILTILTYCIILLGAAPVLPYVDMSSRLIFVAAFVFGILFDWKGRHHIRGILPTLISIGFFLYYATLFSNDNPVIPAVNLLVILLSVRLLGDKTERNSMQIVVLSLFALAGSSLLNLSMAFLFYLVFFFIFIAVFLVFLNFNASGTRQAISSAELKKILAAALAMPALSLPLLAVFFIIIPRTQYPLWNFLNTSGQKVTGFSERVEPGSSVSVNEMKKVVFRAQSPRLTERELYWRGIVLNTIEDKAWVRSEKQPKENAFPGKGRVVRQTIYPEPNTGSYLFTLNVPQQIFGTRADSQPDAIFVRKDFPQKRIKYDSVSVLTDIIGIRGTIDRGFYLQLPQHISSRVVSLAASISARGKTDQEKVNLLGDYFVSRKFFYATRNLPRASDPTDEFIFSKKAGNCEFFATSFAVLLRLMGIPSRLVGGYYGGEYNDMGGYYVITEDMAHIWLEAYIKGKGWLMIDPTRFSANFAQIDKAPKRGAFTGARLLVDSLGYYWNQAVICYDLEKQLQILRKTNEAVQGVHFSYVRWQLLFFALPVLLCTFPFIFRKKFRYVSREEKIVKRFMKRVRKKYPLAVIDPAAGLQDIAKAVNEPGIHHFADLYCSVVYRDRKLSDDEYMRLCSMVDKL